MGNVASQPVAAGFEALFAQIKKKVKADGAFSANVTKEIAQAAKAATTSGDALLLAKYALELSTKNPVHKNGVSTALEAALDKITTSGESAQVLKAIVNARQDAFAIFRLNQIDKLTGTAVEKFLRSGEPAEEMARQALKLVKPGEFGPKPPIVKGKSLDWLIKEVSRYFNALLGR